VRTERKNSVENNTVHRDRADSNSAVTQYFIYNMRQTHTHTHTKTLETKHW